MKRVLFISYYFPPFLGVSSNRVGYWAANLSKFYNEFECDVITAIKTNTAKDGVGNVYFVEDKKNVFTSLKYFISDEGVTWKLAIKKFILNNLKGKRSYEYTIITGGPFMQFNLGRLLKKVFGCKVILDFRDPFINPVFKSSFTKNWVKKVFQKGFLRWADSVITVNKRMIRYISDRCYKGSFVVIPNGFDDITVNNYCCYYEPHDDIRIAYSGRFYPSFSQPFNLLNVISSEPEKYSFHYMGHNEEYIKRYLGLSCIKSYGLLSYYDMIRYLCFCDIGVIFTNDLDYMGTTKGYDYIGAKKVLLVIYPNEICYNSELFERFNDYPMLYWSRDNEGEIKQTLLEIEKDLKTGKFKKLNDFNTYKYSRKFGLDELVKEILI